MRAERYLLMWIMDMQRQLKFMQLIQNQAKNMQVCQKLSTG